MIYLELINSIIVDQGWELFQFVFEGIFNWIEGNDDVEVFTVTVYKEGKQGQGVEVGYFVFCLGQWFNSLLCGKME